MQCIIVKIVPNLALTYTSYLTIIAQNKNTILKLRPMKTY